MTILAFLQNQWFREPEKVKAVYACYPEHRNRLIAAYLFMGCQTGKRLRATLGATLCKQIVWEECSPEIGGHANSAFPADLDHMRAAITKHKPDVVVTFGKLATEAIQKLAPACRVITGPHPTSRNSPVPELYAIGRQLRHLTQPNQE
jgi:hypothetical protein